MVVRKAITILFIAYYSIGTLLFPMGDLSCFADLSDMYAQCQHEDPDLDIYDFVIEHLLNINDIRGEEHDIHEHELPHQPLLSHGISPLIMNVVQPVTIVMCNNVIYLSKKVYSMPHETTMLSDYNGNIFHPPIC
jgi:hypothetical protein